MKSKIAFLFACSSLIGFAVGQTTQNFPDATGEIDPNVGNFPHLDITSVDVTVSADETTVTFKINLAGSPLDSPDGQNWGKYMIAIKSGAGGATAGNGWSRPINFTSGMTQWIGAWADAGGNACGANSWAYASGSWGMISSSTPTKDATGITITETAANLGLAPGEVFSFDVYSSGGGGADSAVDSLSASSASINGWSGPYTTNAVGAGTNAALEFTMPGTLTFENWITGFGLLVGDQDPGDDPDMDNLTNQQEFDAHLDLNPNSDDTDSDNLTDDLEDGTMIYNGPADPGTFPAIYDSDGDTYGDGDEADGSAFGYETDPTVRNFYAMTVAGNFPENSGDHWAADGSSIGTDMEPTGDTDLIGQFAWTLDYHAKVLGPKVYKLVGDHNWNNSWGVGGASGNDIGFTITATGIHHWEFNNKTEAYSVVRADFPDSTAFLAAYGLTAGGDDDSDNVLNEDEFDANTDPTNPDTDGDGKTDDVDPDPLVANRDIEFTVNMTVQEALGNFNPVTGSVVVKFFSGVASGEPDLVLTEVGDTGIYTGTLTDVAGPVGSSFGTYKFFNTTASAPNSGYEDGFDRSFNLGAGDPSQILDTVYFSNNSTLPGYLTWAAANANNQTAGEDFDGDGVTNGVEFFMGETGSTFTANPAPVGGTITWPRDASAIGVTFKVLSSDNLSSWTDVTGDADTSDPNSVSYTLPAGDPKRFVRLEITVQ